MKPGIPKCSQKIPFGKVCLCS